MEKEKEIKFKVDVIFGHVELRSWIEFDGEKFIGMGSCTKYDRDGKIESHKVEPSGLVATYT